MRRVVQRRLHGSGRRHRDPRVNGLHPRAGSWELAAGAYTPGGSYGGSKCESVFNPDRPYHVRYDHCCKPCALLISRHHCVDCGHCIFSRHPCGTAPSYLPEQPRRPVPHSLRLLTLHGLPGVTRAMSTYIASYAPVAGSELASAGVRLAGGVNAYASVQFACRRSQSVGELMRRTAAGNRSHPPQARRHRQGADRPRDGPHRRNVRPLLRNGS